jgi:hypothetical protein
MTELNDRVSVELNVGDAVLSAPSFSSVAVLAKHGQTGLNRVETYTSLSAVTSVFSSFSPVGVAASLFFGQARTPDKFLVIFRGDAETVAVAMNAAVAFNSDFYFVCSLERDNDSIEALQDWASSNERLTLFTSADSTAPTATETDSFFYGSDLSYNRAAGYYLESAGIDIVATSITVSSTTATVASVGHGAVVGDEVYVWESTTAALINKWTVATVVDADSFTFEVPAGTATDSDGGIKILINGKFLEVGLLGLLSSTEPGRRTFDLQTVTGIPADTLTGTEQGFLAGKNANYYTKLGNLSITSGLKSNGFGGKTLSGRNIALQWFIDWYKANVQVDIAQVLVNSGGELGFDEEGLQKIQTAIETRCQTSFDNGAITTFPDGQFAGRNYVVQMPSLASITSTDRINGLLDSIKVYMFFKSKIKGVEIEVTVSI